MKSDEEKKPLTPEEQWRAVLLQAEGPEARELDEMSDEEVDAELRKSGIDPDRLARDGQALADRLMREAGILPPESAPAVASTPDVVPEAPPSGPAVRDLDRTAKIASIPVQAQPAEVLEFPSAERRRRPRWPLLLVAAALAAASIGTGVVIATRDEPAPPKAPYPQETPQRHEPPPSQVAGELRHAAQLDCDEHIWKRCLDRLDQARELDPAGDTADEVQALRTLATYRLTPRDASVGDEKKGDKKGSGK